MSARTIYRAKLRAARALNDRRVDRGLPHHPDGSGFALCPVCWDAGELMVDCADPQDDFPEPCTNPDCLDGYVADGHVDPILRLRVLRREATTRRPWARMRYGAALSRTYSPVRLPDAPVAFRLADAA